MDTSRKKNSTSTRSDNTTSRNLASSRSGISSSSYGSCLVVEPQTLETQRALRENRLPTREEMELRCTQVRWFYRESKKTLWIPFNGRDSIMLEIKYRKEKKIKVDEEAQWCYKWIRYEMNISNEKSESDDNSEKKRMIVVLNGQYKANVNQLSIDPIYWKDDSKEIRRGTWFTSTYRPLEMSLSDQLEMAYYQSVGRFVDFVYSSNYQRGYVERASWYDKSRKIDRLILVIHGIGHKGNENGIVKNAKQINNGVLSAMKKFYPESTVAPMFFPIEWRSSLKLNEELIDAITLPELKTLRTSAGDIVMDVLYYESTVFKPKIIRSVVAKLNQTYKLFKSHNPDFNGPVHILGHSLGSVITHDILSEYAMEEQTNEEIEGGSLQEERLCFKVKYFFAVGSPLATFLEKRAATKENLLPEALNVERIFNIFNPYDLIAYRLEPILNIAYKDISPVKIFSKSDPRTKAAYENHSFDFKRSFLNEIWKKKDAGGIPWNSLATWKTVYDERLPHRTDYQIEPTLLEKVFLGWITTHTAYWTNEDLALFLANVIVHET